MPKCYTCIIKFILCLSFGSNYPKTGSFGNKSDLSKLTICFSVTYVLTDFGGARALDDEETFTSIYGTEEYLVSRAETKR